MRSVILFFLVVLIVMIMGCESLVPWNPVLDGIELDKSISFIHQGTAVTIVELGFVNSHWDPEVRLDIRNCLTDTMRFSPNDFKILIGPDTLTRTNPSESITTLLPGEKLSFFLRYKYNFHNHTPNHTPVQFEGHILEIPNPSSLLFNFPAIDAGGKTINIPKVKFVYPHSLDYLTKLAK